MLNKNLIIALSAVFSFSIATSASAAFTHGTLAETSTKSGGCNPNYCSGGGYSYVPDGGVGETSATSTQGTNAQAYATLTGSLNSPELKTYTHSTNGNFSGSTAQGIQLYQYTGTSPFLLSVNANFHGFLYGEGAYFSGDASLIKAEGNEDTVESLFSDGFMPNLYESSISFFDLAIGGESANGEDNSGENDLNFDISLMLETGDLFYLWTAMYASSYSGATVDALNTGTFSFNTSNLVALGGGSTGPSVSAVPVPAAAWLFAPSLLGFVALRRRKQK